MLGRVVYIPCIKPKLLQSLSHLKSSVKLLNLMDTAACKTSTFFFSSDDNNALTSLLPSWMQKLTEGWGEPKNDGFLTRSI